jgi:hypothetical protein
MANTPATTLDQRQREMARALFGDDFEKILSAAQRMKQLEQPPPAARAPASPEAFRQIARMAFEDSDRGARARAAWQQILAGALELVKIWTDEQPPAPAP